MTVAGVALRDYSHPGSTEQYYPDTADPIDRWFQASFSANARTVERVIVDVFGGTPRQIVDPFCGAGSTAVAARRLQVPFLGIELDPILAEISRLKLSLSVDDLPLVASVLPSSVSVDWLMGILPTVMPRCVVGAALVGILAGRPRELKSSELLSLLSAGLLSTTDPTSQSGINCADSRRTEGWEGAQAVQGTVVFASPPFCDSDVGQWEDAVALCNISQLREVIATEVWKHPLRSVAPKEEDSIRLICSVLTAGRQACSEFLSIVEYEDTSGEMLSIGSVVAALNALPGMEVIEVLRTGNFSGKATLFEIIAESRANNGGVDG